MPNEWNAEFCENGISHGFVCIRCFGHAFCWACYSVYMAGARFYASPKVDEKQLPLMPKSVDQMRLPGLD
jgi:hypothetical protein